MNKTIITAIILCLFSPLCLSQTINCDSYHSDQKYYKACKLFTMACREKQGSKKSQQLLDKTIQKCPYFSHAYYVKAIPYLKRGLFIQWKELIDKAVFYNPVEYLGYRGGCRFQFLRDYHGAIKDIENLISISDNDIGYIYNGDYHLTVILALSYSAINKKKKALNILESYLNNIDYSPGPYDYLHLGILKLDCNDIMGAIESFKIQIKLNDFVAESYYHLGISYERIQEFNESLYNFKKAKAYYLKGDRLPGRGFMDYYHKIYLKDINTVISTYK